tara:strand:+ start:224 stop:424 length:201 start_codon:yes stop_codon:yes gene_type:complete
MREQLKQPTPDDRISVYQPKAFAHITQNQLAQNSEEFIDINLHHANGDDGHAPTRQLEAEDETFCP